MKVISCWTFKDTWLSSKHLPDPNIPTMTHLPLQSDLVISSMGPFHLSHFSSWALVWLGAPGGHLCSWKTQASSKLVLRSQPRAQVGFHIQVSDLFLATANFCRSEAAHSQRVRKASQLPWPLASILTSHLYRWLPHLYLQPRSHPALQIHTSSCILYISTQMISKVLCPKLSSPSHSHKICSFGPLLYLSNGSSIFPVAQVEAFKYLWLLSLTSHISSVSNLVQEIFKTYPDSDYLSPSTSCPINNITTRMILFILEDRSCHFSDQTFQWLLIWVKAIQQPIRPSVIQPHPLLLVPHSFQSILASLLFLQHARYVHTPQPLHLLFPVWNTFIPRSTCSPALSCLCLNVAS